MLIVVIVLFFDNQSQELPEQWNNTKKIAVTVKQQVAPLQAGEVSCIRKKIQAFDGKQTQYRENFKKYAFMRFVSLKNGKVNVCCD